MVSVTLAVACLFAAVSAAASSAQCDFGGPFQAYKSVNGPGNGGYYLRKTTKPGTPECAYVLVPQNTLSEGQSTSFTYGKLQNGQMIQLTATVTVNGDKIEVTGAGQDLSGTTTVLFSDYRSCDVMRGPDGNYELWVHSSAINLQSYGCCDTKFAQVAGGRPIHHTWQTYCPPLPRQ
uniref:Lipocalin n=2 Tax=Argas monolakensis TaxID=34602 RepID=Q09JR9_ARGMO|nr:lipocalin [Argas monolakensis]